MRKTQIFYSIIITPKKNQGEYDNIIWANYEYAWGGSYQSYYKEQSLNGCAIIESDLQPIRFQGQFFDQETELHYNRFRYYDTDVGMFIQKDPIGLLGGYNIFQYAPNPVGWVVSIRQVFYIFILRFAPQIHQNLL